MMYSSENIQWTKCSCVLCMWVNTIIICSVLSGLSHA